MLKKSKSSFTKQQVFQVLDQAISKAQTYKRLTNDRILSSLKRFGVATQAEVDALQSQVKKLEGELLAQAKKRAEKAAAAKAAAQSKTT